VYVYRLMYSSDTNFCSVEPSRMSLSLLMPTFIPSHPCSSSMILRSPMLTRRLRAHRCPRARQPRSATAPREESAPRNDP
jgi:hypothetical protein